MAVRPPPICADMFQRWLHNDCYCPVGLFWQHQPQAMALDSPRVGPGPRMDSWLAGGEQHPWCTLRGLELWGAMYPAYALAAGCGFTGTALWSALRLRHGFGTASAADQRLQFAIHGFCLGAAVVRLSYIICEASLVHTSHGDSFLQRMAGASYTAFFPLSAAAFLCTCQHWLRLIEFMDQVVEKPWYRNPLILVCLLFLFLEALHDFMYMSGAHPVIDGVYFFWLSLISVFAALLGVSIARRLYSRLRLWLTADAGLQVFKRTLMSAALVSASAVCMLILSIIQALVGRYYPWPCFDCWVFGRLLEFLYLVIMLSALGRAQERAPNLASVTGGSTAARGSSFADSFMSTDAPGWEALWISPPAPARRSEATATGSEASARRGGSRSPSVASAM
ncbi:unnamed protein product [Effrenium voratum]|uniref:Uncharacterized protein n=1 Tax=Effrenium voratum TaxID=2562239 RepID=A0AA36J4Z1_9DINO|nr:unnamed protein product [Effrenium voratum]